MLAAEMKVSQSEMSSLKREQVKMLANLIAELKGLFVLLFLALGHYISATG